MYFPGPVGMANEVSFHAPHLIDSSGSLIPAALIPFCSFKANMDVLGKTKDSLNFTACSQFQPTVLEGQLCYSLNLSLLNIHESKPGKVNGLWIVLDPGPVDHEPYIEAEEGNIKNVGSLSLDGSAGDSSSARIYLNTLAGFTAYNAGSYALFTGCRAG